MPSAPLRLCAADGCQERVPQGRCQLHTRAQERARGTSTERGYDGRWAGYSRRWRRAHPRCGERADGQQDAQHSACVREGRIAQAEVVDHIVPHRGDRALFWSIDNHQSLCAHCHNVKTATEDRGEGGSGSLGRRGR